MLGHMGRKADQTRATILAAAREAFAASGYDGATIRAIAAAADIDPSMVMRYFGTKDLLFAAAAEFDLQFPDLSGVAPADIGARMVGHFFDRWEGDEALVMLLRASTTNADAAQRMREIFVEQLTPAVARFDPVDAPQRAGLIASQVLGLALCRFVLHIPPIVVMSRDEVVAAFGPTLQRYLSPMRR
jgi:AcrR family transcriptional regulator